MKWKKDHKIPNTKSKLTEARSSGSKFASNFDGDSDNLDDSSNVYYEDEEDDNDEDEDEQDIAEDLGHMSNQKLLQTQHRTASRISNAASKSLLI